VNNDPKFTRKESMSENRVEELKKRISALKSQWPKHSVPPGLIQQLDDLEEELERELQKIQNQNQANPTD
jgi:hypothetical protein